MSRARIARYLLVAAILSCIFQLLWFGPKCFNAIDYDGMSYTGIARHLHQGEFHVAINGFRSPMISWLIAGVSFLGDANYLDAGKLISIASFVLTMVLLYSFTKSLWHSTLAAAAAVLLFTLARGLVSMAVLFVTPDFLFADVVLLYFMVLLRLLREPERKNWMALGAIHGLAFLVKAFALPWLAFCTLMAVIFAGGSRKTLTTRLASAALAPIIIAGVWALVLHSKYEVFTTGTQFKANLLEWTLKASDQRDTPTYALLTDTTKNVDAFMMDDPMPPGSWQWTYSTSVQKALPNIWRAEVRNVPRMLREIVLVVTPGGVLAFILALVILYRRKAKHRAEWQLAAVVAASIPSLVFAYCMLVFDARYLFPLIPLVLAVASWFLVADATSPRDGLCKLAIALAVLGVVVSVGYESSPFRLITRDFQLVCYDAGRRLAAHGPATVVSLGSGPFPGHGVGWEAGYKAAYFGRQTIIAARDVLPDPTQMIALTNDLRKASPNAILIWGTPDDAKYGSVVENTVRLYPKSSQEKIMDPVVGEVGTVVRAMVQVSGPNLQTR